MGKKTSVWLPDDLAEAVAVAGVPMADLIRRGLGLPPLMVREAASAAAEHTVEVMREDVRQAVREGVREGVRDALRDLREGGF